MILTWLQENDERAVNGVLDAEPAGTEATAGTAAHRQAAT